MDKLDNADNKSGWSASDIGHAVLDTGGLVPGVGEFADLANAVWYAEEGNYLDAGLSLISTIPIVGDVIGKGAKLEKKLGPKATKKVLEAVKAINIPKFIDRFRYNPKIAKHLDRISDALGKWQDGLTQKFSSSKVAKGIKECSYKFKITSSGAVLKPNPNKTTTILGRYDKDMNRIINNELKVPKNTDFGPKNGGFNVLNVPDEMYKTPDQFWNEVNKPWLDEAIKRGDDIVMASDPTLARNLWKKGEGKKGTETATLTGFGQEVVHLLRNGYSYDQSTKMMVKKPRG